MFSLMHISQVVSRHNTVERDAAPDRMIVVARGKEDVSYLSIFLPDIPHTVYQVNWTIAAHANPDTTPLT